MKNPLRKPLALLLCGVLALGLAPAAFAADSAFSFPDGSVAEDEIVFPDPVVDCAFTAELSFDESETYDALEAAPGGSGGVFTVPAGTTLIETEAFANVHGMAEVHIPASVTTIGSRAFYGCLNLIDVYYDGTSEAWSAIAIEEERGALASARIHFINGETWIPNAFPFFPDATFRSYIRQFIDINPHDGYLSPGEMAAVERINCSGTTDQHIPIQTLKGIEYFGNLKELYCVYNELPALDVSQNANLEILYCQNNSLTALNLLSNSKLRVLSASNNKLTQLNLSGNPRLETLFAHYNNLTALDMSANPELNGLFAAYNKLQNLNLRSNPKLARVELLGNSLSSLDVSGNANLIHLLCGKNSLRSLNVANNTALQKLDCHENALTGLDVSRNTALQDLNIAVNTISSLNVSKNTLLERLQCYSNRLSSLTLGRNSSLQRLNCADNSLSLLDISLCSGLLNVVYTLTPVLQNNVVYYFEDLDSPYLVLDKSTSINTGTVVDIPITEAYFPDPTFRRGVQQNYDKNNDYKLSYSEIRNVTNMYLSNLGISSLKGIEYFTELETLICRNNPGLNTLDISALKDLQVLECYGTGIRALYLRNNTYLRALVYDSHKEQQGSRIVYSNGPYLLSFPTGTVLYTD